MNSNKRVLMVLPVMKGGGAERVAALLSNEFYNNGYEVKFLLTSSAKEAVINRDLNEKIPLTLLKEQGVQCSGVVSSLAKIVRVGSSLLCRIFETMKRSVPAYLAYLSFWSQYRTEIHQLRELMKQEPKCTIIAFLQPSIPMVLLAARGLPNKIIISERGDPKRLMKKRFGFSFIKKYYKRADHVVFQTQDAKETYPEEVSCKGVVIPNPVKSDLLAPYFGERNRNITTFCRISAQKNLSVLLEAFVLLHNDYPDYKLRIIGDVQNEEDAIIKANLIERIEKLNLIESVIFEPFNKNVHPAIMKDAMYVNSSDYEGISNAMLEAMAIGMPVVCTDCPIGGARATIQNGENGLLVPVGDVEKMYQAMKMIIEDRELAQKMSYNATKIRESLSLDSIAKKWMQLL